MTFAQDVRFGLRSMAKSPGFTAVAISSLALGIMATTAMYSVVYAVILDPFPYKDVDTLMSVKVWEPGARGFRAYYTPDEYLEIADRNTIFDGVISSTINDVEWTGIGEPRRLRGNYATPNTFNVLGVPPLLGRYIVPSDGGADAPPVAVLGYRFWQRQFGGSPGVLGRQMRLNGVVRTVVGVMPQRFMWRGADVYIPIVFHRGQVVEDVQIVHVLGRLKPGVTQAQAEGDLRPIIADLKKQFPRDFPDKWRVGLLSFRDTFPSSITQGLWILFGAVALLLLIACSNVSNLLLSRATARQKEMAIRASLGAGRMRLLRQLLTESLVLALAASGLGVVLAIAALKAIISIVPPGTIPDEAHIAVNTPVLLFTVAIAMVTSILFGLAPAMHACIADLAKPLKETGRGSTGGSRQAWVRNTLVIIEVAFSLMLLIGATLMIRTLIARQSFELGFRTANVLTMRIPLSEQRYPDASRRVTFLRELLRRVKALPGVSNAAVNTGLHPLGDWGGAVEVAGSSQTDTRRVEIHQISEGYPAVFGIPLLQGRWMSTSEIAGAQHVALVNRLFADRYLSNANPLGAMVRIPMLARPPFGLPNVSFQIVGVVRDAANNVMGEQTLPEIYLPFTTTGRAQTLVIRTQLTPMALAHAIQQEVYAIDKDQPLTDVMPLEAVLDQWVYAGPRFNLALFAVFATLGLALAAIGVYGVISYMVTQQRQEIGLRIALGAGFRDIAGLVLGRGFRLLAAGIGLGLIGSFATTRLLAKQLYDVSPFDPLSFSIVAVILLLVGLQACFWPARRAARVDPVTALRYE